MQSARGAEDAQLEVVDARPARFWRLRVRDYSAAAWCVTELQAVYQVDVPAAALVPYTPSAAVYSSQHPDQDSNDVQFASNIFNGITSDEHAARWRSTVANDNNIAEKEWIGLDLGVPKPVSFLRLLNGFDGDVKLYGSEHF